MIEFRKVCLSPATVLQLHANAKDWEMPLSDFRKLAAKFEELELSPLTGQVELLAQPETLDKRIVAAVGGTVFFAPREIELKELKFSFGGSGDV